MHEKLHLLLYLNYNYPIFIIILFVFLSTFSKANLLYDSKESLGKVLAKGQKSKVSLTQREKDAFTYTHTHKNKQQKIVNAKFKEIVFKGMIYKLVCYK